MTLESGGFSQKHTAWWISIAKGIDYLKGNYAQPLFQKFTRLNQL